MTTCLLVAAAVGPCATHAVAAERAWRGTSDAVWTNANNWDDTSSAPGTGDTAIFNDAGNGQTTINLGGGVAISTIQFDTSTAAAYTIGSGGVGSQTLSLDNLGAVTMSASVAANETFNANVLLGTGAAGSWTFTNDSTTNALLFAGAVSGGTGGSAGTVALTVNGAGATNISGTVSNGGASSIALTKSGTGTLTLSGNNTRTGVTGIDGGILRLGSSGALGTSGSITMGGGTLQFSTFNNTDYSSRFGTGVNQFSIDTNGVDATLASQIISSANASTFTKLGAGKLTLSSGTSRYTGATTISGGILSVGTLANGGSDSSIGTSTNDAANLVFDGGALQYTGGNVSTNRNFTINTGKTATFDIASAGTTLTVSGASTATNGALTKTGAGGLTLTAANLNTGITTLNGGTLTLSGAAGALASSTGVTFNGGTLTLTNTTAGEGSVNRIGSVDITSNGGTLNYNNSVNVAASETLGSLLSSSGRLNVVLTPNNTSAIETLTFGDLIQSGTGSVAFSNPSKVAAGFTAFNVVTVTDKGTTTAGQIIGPWATIGTATNNQSDYAVYSSNNIAAANIAANNTESTWGSGANINIGTGPTLTATRTLNTLRTSATAMTVTMNQFNLETLGLLHGGGNGLFFFNSTSGVLRQNGTSAANLYVTTGTGGVTINAPIQNNTGALTLVKNGTVAQLILAGLNTFTGGVVLEAGTIQLNSTTAPGTGTLNIFGGTTLDTTTANNYLPANNPITINGDFTFNGTQSLNFGTGAITLGTLPGSSTANSRTITANTAASVLTFGGAIANGTTVNSLTKAGAGVLLLRGNNTYTGATSVTAGTLILGGTSAATGGTSVTGGTLFARQATALGSNGGIVTVNNAGFNYAASADEQLTVNGAMNITAGASLILGGSIGSTTTSAMVNVAGAATISNAAQKINVFGLSGVTPSSGTYTLIHGGAGSSLNPATAPTINFVYNNSNFTIGDTAPTITRSGTDLQIDITSATPLTTAFWRGNLSGASQVWAASNGLSGATGKSNWVTSLANANQPLVPGSGTDVIFANATFQIGGTGANASTLGADMTIKSITHTDNGTNIALNQDGFSLTITPASADAGIFMYYNGSAVPGLLNINTPVILGASQTWRNDGTTSNLTIGGNITNGSSNLIVHGTGNTTITGSFIGSGSGTLTKYGTATLTLQGANTNTGNVSLYQGNTTLSGDLGTLKNAAIIFNGGSLTLGANTNIQGAVDRLGSSNAITSYGGTLTYANTSTVGVTFAETIGAVALNNGVFNVVENTNMAGAGTPTNAQTLTLAGLTQSGAATATFSSPTTAPNATTNVIKVTGATATGAGQIIGPWATTGTAENAQTDYAVYDGSTNIVPAAIAASAESTWTTAANTYTIGASQTLTATRAITALRANTNDMAVTMNQFNLETLGLLNGSGAIFTINGTSGVLRQQGTSAANMYLNTGSAAMTINANIADNGAGALTLVKTGKGGTLILAGLNTFTGGAVVNAGTVQINATNSLFTTALGTGTVFMSGGALDSFTAGMTNLNNNALSINGDFTFTGTQSLNFGTGAVSLGTTPGISRTITVNTNKFTLGGVISDGTTVNSLTKAGNNNLVLSGANTYTGETVLSAALLQLGTGNVGSVGSITSSAIGTGPLVFNGGGISSDSITNRTILNPVTFTGHATVGDGSSNATLVASLGKITFSAPVNLGQAVRTITTPGGDVQFDGALSGLAGGITKAGIGTLILNATNTYGDQTNVSLGTLRLGASGTLPTGTNVAVASSTANQWAVLDLNGRNATIGTLVLGGRALSVNNAAQAANGTGSALVTTGSGTLTLGGDLTYDSANNPFTSYVAGNLSLGAANRNFAVGNSAGTNANPDLVVSAVVSAPGAQTLTLNGAGQVLFSGNNTYAGQTILTAGGTLFITGNNTTTGATTISGGTVIARSVNALGGSGNTAGVTVAASQNLTYNALTDAALAIGGNLSYAGAGTLGASIGSNFTTDAINVTGNATTTASAITVNIFGNSLSRTVGGTGDYTLIAGGGSSTLNNATYTLGTIYNNTNFTVGALTKTATDLKATVTNATALTTAYWKGTGTNSNTVWSASSNGAVASNWATTLAGTTISAVVPGPSTDVFFSATGTTSIATSTLGADMAIQSLTQQSGAAMTVNANGYTLTITPDVGTKGINLLAQAALTFNANLAAGANQTWSNTSGAIFTVNGNVNLGSNALTVTGANQVTVVGQVSGSSGSIVKNGTNILNLSGNNTFSGGITVNQGTVQLGNPTALGTGPLTFAGAGATLDSSFTNLILTTNNAVALNADFTFTGGQALNLGTGNVTLGTASTATSTTRTITVNTNPLTLGGVIANSGSTTGLAKAGNNVLLLNGQNTYTGNTAITNATLKIGQSNAIASGNAMTLFGVGGTPIFDLNGFNQNLGSLTMSSLQNDGTSTVTNLNVASPSTLTLSGGATALTYNNVSSSMVNAVATISVNTVDLNGAATFNIGTGTGVTITSIIQNGDLTKVNPNGTLILQGVNTYAGATNIYGGTLQVIGNLGTINQSASIAISGGGLLALVNAVNQTGIDRVKNTAPIASYGGGINFNNPTASAGVVYAETLGAVTLNSGQFNTTLLVTQAATNSQTLTLTSLTQAGAATATFSAATNILNNSYNMLKVSGVSATTAGQILGPWATTGVSSGDQRDYAVYDASGRILPANITGVTVDSTWTTSGNSYTAGTGGGFNFNLTANRTMAALRGNGNNDTLNMQQFNLLTYGILHGGLNAWNINSSGGVLTTPSGGGNLFLTAGRQRLNVNAPITDNGGAVSLVKSGGQSLYLYGPNSYTGGTVLNAGTLFLNATSVQTFGGTGTITFAGGTLDNENVLFPTITNAVVLDGAMGWGGTASNNLVLSSNVTLGTTPGDRRTINVANSSNLAFKGIVSNGTTVNSIEKLGNGNLILFGANTYTSSIIRDGKILLAGANDGTVGSITSSPIGTGNLVFNGGGIASFGTAARTILNPVSFNGSDAQQSATLGDAFHNGKLTFSAGFDLGFAPRRIDVPSEVQIDGVISGNSGTAGGGLAKTGLGVLTLTNANNSYQGITVVGGGVLRPTVVGAIPANTNMNVTSTATLGTATLDLATNSIDLTVGTLRMGASNNIYADQSTFNAVLSSYSLINTGTATLTLGGDFTLLAGAAAYSAVINGNLALGTLNLTINNPLSADPRPIASGIGATPYFARNIVVNDSTQAGADLNINAVISGVGVGINKSGGGVLQLSANNTFSGGILVSNGTLMLTGTNATTLPTTLTSGTILARTAGALGGTSNATFMTMAANTTLNYNALTDTQLQLGGNLTITGATTNIGGSIGSTPTSAAINVAGLASATAAMKTNIFGISGVTPQAGTYTLIQGGTGSTLSTGTGWGINAVYNNTNFTVTAPTASATAVTTVVTPQTALTAAYWRGGLTTFTQVMSASSGIAGTTGTAAGNWATTLGGVTQVLIPGPTTDVFFQAPISGTASVTVPNGMTLGTDMSIRSLTFNNFVDDNIAITPDGYTLTIGAGGLSLLGGRGDQTLNIGANILLNGAQTWTNNTNNGNFNPQNPSVNLGRNILTVYGNVNNNGNLLTVNAATGRSDLANVNLLGVISGSGGLTKIGGNILALAGPSTYSGATTINYGTIQLDGPGAPGASPLGTSDGGTYVNGNNATLDLNGQSIYTAEPLFLNGNSTNGTLTNYSSTASMWSGPITLQSDSSIGNSVIVGGAGAFTGGGFNLTLLGNNSSNGNFARVIDTGVASLTKAGNQTWTLSGANTYTGPTLVSNGKLKLGVSNAIPSANTFGLVSVGGAANFDLNGFNQSLSNLNISSLQNTVTTNITSSLGTSTLTLTGGANALTYTTAFTNLLPGTATISNVTVNLNGAATFNIADGVSNPDLNITSVVTNGSLTKTNNGQIALQGVNTYTGSTNILGGQLQVSGNVGTINQSSGIVIGNGGTFILTNTQAQTGINRVGNSAGITSYGGGIQFNNTAGAGVVYAETVGAVATSVGQLDVSLGTDQNSGSGNSQTLTLGGLSQSGTGIVTFTGSVAPNTSTNIIVNTAAVNAATPTGQIIGPWAVVGINNQQYTDYAVYNAAGQIVPAAIAKSSETTWTNPANAYTMGGTGFGLGGNETLTANRTVAALKDVGSGDTLTLNGFNLETNGLFNYAPSRWYLQSTGGVIRQVGTAPGNLYVTTTNQGGIQINAPIADNTGALTLVKSGYQSLYLAGANTFTGGVVLNAGTLYINSVSGLGGTAAIVAAGGSLDNDNVQLPAVANGLTLNGSFTYGGSINYSLTLNGPVSLGTTPGAYRTIGVNSSANLVFNGVVSNGTTVNSIEKTGSGNLVLNNQNTYSGDTILSSGAVQIGVNSIGSVGSITSGAIGTGRILFNGGGLATDATARTIINPVAFSGNSGNTNATLGAGVGGGLLTFTAPIDFGFAPRVINTAGNVRFDSVLSGYGVGAGSSGIAAGGGLIKGGAGLLTLTNAGNTYNGSTAVVGGILRPTVVGAIPANTNLIVASNLSYGTAVLDLATNSINLTIGTLNMGGLSNGAVNATAAGYSQINTGSATLTLGGTLTLDSATNHYASTITGNLALGTANLTQYNTGINQYSGVPSYFARDFNVNDNSNASIDLNVSAVISGTAGLAKNGGGVLLLSANNTYSGATIVTAGNLVLSGDKSTTGITMVNAGTLTARSANALGGTGNTAGVTVATGANFTYNPTTDAALAIGGAWTVSGPTNLNVAPANVIATIGTAIGSGLTSAQINVAGAATIANGTQTINIFGVPGATPATGTYTLIHGGAGSSLNPATAPTLGYVYNNTNFTVGAFTRSATDLQVAVTGATALTSAYWRGGLSGATTTWSASNGSTASNWSSISPAGAAQGLIPGIGTDVYLGVSPAVNDAWTSYLGADMSIKSLTVNTTNTNQSLKLFADGYSLTIGSGGINIISAPDQQRITINTDIKLAAAQTWTINSPFVSPPNYGRNFLDINGNVDNQGNLLTINTVLASNAQNTPTINGIISGSGGLTKNGVNQMYLSGPNTYSGPTTINGGSISVSGQGGSIASSSGISITPGTYLQVVNSGANESYVDRVSNSAPITTYGGQLYFNNATASNVHYSETIGTVASTSGQNDIVLQSNASAANNSQTLILSGLTHTGASNTSTVTFSGAVGDISTNVNGLDATNNIMKVTGATQTTAGQIIAPWATVGINTSQQRDYAVYDANSNIVAANIAGSAETTWNNANNAYTMGDASYANNTNQAAQVNVTLTANRTIAALRNFGHAQTLALGANNLYTYGLLHGGRNVWSINSTGGVVTTPTGGGNLYVTAGNNFDNLQIALSANVTDNGGAVTLVKSGYNNLYLRGTNTYTGGTVFNAGTVFINNASALSTGGLNFAGGSLDTETASLTLPNNPVTINADFTFAGSTNNSLNLGTGAVTLGTNTGTNRTINVNNAGVLTIGGVIGNGTTANSLTKANGGTLVLRGANTYTGTTTITGGTLKVTNASGLGTGSGNNVSLAQSTALNYAASADAQLAIGGTLSITSGGTTTIGGSIGATTTSAQVNVAGLATATTGAVKVNVYGINGVSPSTGTYTLFNSANGSSTLNNPTYSLGFVYNNTNFSVGTPTGTATSVTVPITSVAGLTSAYWMGGLSSATNIWAASNGSASNWVTAVGGGATAVVPGATTDVFLSATTISQNPNAMTLGANMTIKSLTITTTSTPNDVNLNSDGSTLTIGTGGLTMNSGAPVGGNANFNADLVMNAAQSWTNNNTSRYLVINGGVANGGNLLTIAGSGPTNLNGTISGGGGLTMNATDNLILAVGNTFGGGVTLNNGTIFVNNATALGAGSSTLTIAGGNLDTSSASVTNPNNNPVTINSNFTFGAATNNALTLGTGAVSLGTTAGTSRTITVPNAATLTFGGPISNGTTANALTKAGTGTLALFGNSAYSGPTTISAGTVQINGANSLGDFTQVTNTISMAANTILRSTGNTYDLGANRTITMSGAATIQIDAGTMTVSGAVSKGGNLLTVTGAGNTTFSGGISTAGGITKTGLGTLTIGGMNTYTGATTINGGAVLVNGSTVSGSAFTVTNVNDTTTSTLGGSGTINGAVTISATSATARVNRITGADIGGYGTLTLGGGLTFGSGAVGYFDIQDITTRDFLNITGNLTAASGTVIGVSTGLAPNTYPLIGYTGTASALPNYSLLTLGGAVAPAGYYLTLESGALNLVVAAEKIWSGGAPSTDDNWTTANNWGSPITGGEIVHFYGPNRVTPNNDFAAGTLFAGIAFDSGAAGFTLGGNSIDMSGDLTNNSSTDQIVNLDMSLSRAVGTNVSSVSNNLTLGGILSNGTSTGSLIKSGAGSVTLTAANSYTAGNTVNAGTLAITGSGTLGATSGPLTVDGGTAIVHLGTTSQTVGAVALKNSGQINNGTLTGSSYAVESGSVGAVLAGSGTLTKTTAGSVALSAANTFSGATTISAGAINAAHNSALQNTTVGVNSNNGLTFATGITAPTLGGLQGTGNIALATATSEALTLKVGSNGSTTSYSGVLSGAGGLTKEGNGTLTISKGAVANSYLGATVVSAGTLKLEGFTTSTGVNASWFSGSNQSNLNLEGATFNAFTLGRSFTGSQGALSLTPNNSVVAYAGLVNSFITLGANGDNFTTAWSGRFTPDTTGNYNFASANDDQGVMYLDLNSNGAFDSSERYGGTNGNFSSGKTLTAGTTYNYFYMSHEDGGGESNNWYVTEPGGSQVYVNTAGDANQGGSWTVITGLTATNLLPATTPLTVSSGATLDLDGNAQQFASLTGVSGASITNSSALYDSTLTISSASGSSTFGGVISDGATNKIALTKNGASTQIFTGANTYTGPTTFSGGVLSVATIDNGGVASNLGAATIAAANLVFAGGALQYTGASASTDRSFTINAGQTATFDIASSSTNLILSGASAASSGGLTKTGLGTLTLAGTLAYTGATAITGGTLAIGNGGSGATIGTTSGVGLSNNATIAFNQSSNTAFSPVISGAGSLVKDGSGALTVSGSNSFAGTTTVSDGTLVMGHANALGNASNALVLNAGTLNLSGNSLSVSSLSGSAGRVSNSSASTTAILTANASGNSTFSGVIQNGSGSVGLTKSGVGSLTLAGVNSYTGATTVAGGTLVVNGSIKSNVSTASGAFLSGSGTIGYTGGTTTRVGTLSGAGTISPGRIAGAAGILRAYTFNPSAGLGAAFEFTSAGLPDFTQPTNSRNDVLKLTTTLADPFADFLLTPDNAIDIYFNVAVDSIQPNTTFSGGMFVNAWTGIYTDTDTLIAAVENATYTYWVRSTGSGVRTFNSVNYDSFTSAVTLSAIEIGTTGFLTEFVVVPEPDTIALAGLGIAMAAWTIWKRRRIDQLTRK